MFVLALRNSSGREGFADAVAEVDRGGSWEVLVIDQYAGDFIEKVVGPHELDDTDLGEPEDEVSDRDRVEGRRIGEDSVAFREAGTSTRHRRRSMC